MPSWSWADPVAALAIAAFAVKERLRRGGVTMTAADSTVRTTGKSVRASVKRSARSVCGSVLGDAVSPDVEGTLPPPLQDGVSCHRVRSAVR